MAIAFQTSSAGQAGELGAGTFAGHVLVSHDGCSLDGQGIGVTVVQPDGTYSEAVRPGASVERFTLRNLTIDCQALAAITVGLEIGGGIAELVCENVEILDHKKGAIAVYNRGIFRATNLRIIGNGGGVNHFTGATVCAVDGADIIGGQYGFSNVAAAGIDLRRFRTRHDWWAVPTYEAVTHTGYGALYADVTSHVSGDRTLYDILRHLAPVHTFEASATLVSPPVTLRKHDRVEMADGRWTQVIGFDPSGEVLLDTWRAVGKWRPVATPSGTATVYRVTLGRVYSTTSTRLHFQSVGVPVAPRWFHPGGETASTPTAAAGSRLDVIRVGGANIDIDTGGIHVTETAINAYLEDCITDGGRADGTTVRGYGSVIANCRSRDGQDMAFTIDGTDGPVEVYSCVAERAGRTGFHLTGGPSNLYNCKAYDNGTINDGSGDYGATTTEACLGSFVQVIGARNLDGLVAGAVEAAALGGNRGRHHLYSNLPPPHLRGNR